MTDPNGEDALDLSWLDLLREHRGMVTFEVNSVSGVLDAVMWVHCIASDIDVHATTFPAADAGSAALPQQMREAAQRLKCAEDRHLAGQEVPAWT